MCWYASHWISCIIIVGCYVSLLRSIIGWEDHHQQELLLRWIWPLTFLYVIIRTWYDWWNLLLEGKNLKDHSLWQTHNTWCGSNGLGTDESKWKWLWSLALRDDWRLNMAKNILKSMNDGFTWVTKGIGTTLYLHLRIAMDQMSLIASWSRSNIINHTGMDNENECSHSEIWTQMDSQLQVVFHYG
jgi:hypothetical protein